MQKLLLKERTERYNPIDNTLKLLYVELMIKHTPDNLCHALEQYTFPLDECLDLCLANEHRFGAAYIRFRLGMKKEAMDDYISILSTSF